MKRTLQLSLLFVGCCAAGFYATWLARGMLGGWAVPVALGWVVILTKAFAVGLALRGADR